MGRCFQHRAIRSIDAACNPWRAPSTTARQHLETAIEGADQQGFQGQGTQGFVLQKLCGGAIGHHPSRFTNIARLTSGMIATI
jgi:hypothetical protein